MSKKKEKMFEHKSERILPKKKFIHRQLRFSLYAAFIILVSLGIGIAGYSVTAHLGFLDSLLNASMILTGMGPVNPMLNDASKVFSSLYAIYSGVAFLTTIGVFIAPLLHRFMHKLHLDDAHAQNKRSGQDVS